MMGRLLAATVVIFGLAGCGGGAVAATSHTPAVASAPTDAPTPVPTPANVDNSTAIAASLHDQEGTSIKQQYVAQGSRHVVVTMGDVSCLQTAGTQIYNCIAKYTVVADGVKTVYQAGFPASCDASGACAWAGSTSDIVIG